MTTSHPQQWAIVTEDDRPDAAAVAALAAFPTTQLADCGGPVAIVGSAGSSCAPVTWCAATPAASSSSSSREHVDEVVTLARAVDDVIRVKRRGTGGELP